MKIDRQEIHSSILNFLEFLENGEIPSDIEALELALDRLALMYHFVGEIPNDENEVSEVPAHDYSRWRKLLGKRFPKLGYYNIASTISINIGETDLVTGDGKFLPACVDITT